MFYTYDYKYKTEEVNFYLKKIGGDVMSTYEVIIILLTLSNTMINFISLIIVLIKSTKK